jgi:hypothetical protein
MSCGGTPVRLRGSTAEAAAKLAKLIEEGNALLNGDRPSNWEAVSNLQAEKQIWMDFAQATLSTCFDSSVANEFGEKATSHVASGTVGDFTRFERDALRGGLTYIRSLQRRLPLIGQVAAKAPLRVPFPVVAAVATVLAAEYTHAKLDALFKKTGLADEPLSGMNKTDKARNALGRINTAEAPLKVLGSVLEELMEVDSFGIDTTPPITVLRENVRSSLAKYGLAYATGGNVLQTGTGVVSRNLEQIVRSRDLPGLETEFDRIFGNIEKDPAAAVTSSCALLESLFRIFIEDEYPAEMPADKSIKPLWSVVRKHLRFDPATVGDDDLRKVLSGLASIVDGIAGLRTHKGSAHGQGRKGYRLKPRHARLSAHAAFTLAMFVIEAWDEQKQSSN